MTRPNPTARPAPARKSAFAVAPPVNKLTVQNTLAMLDSTLDEALRLRAHIDRQDAIIAEQKHLLMQYRGLSALAAAQGNR